MADENNITTLAKRLRPFIKLAAQEMVPVTPYDHGDLTGLASDDHTQYVHNTSARTITAVHTFDPVSAGPPFILAADAQGWTVIGLKADQLSKAVTAGSGLIGGGTLTDNITLDINLGSPSGLEISADQLQIADAIAGAGLMISNKILAIGQGDGITVGADAVGLTTPGTLSVSSTNNASGSHTHAITSSSNPGAGASILATDSSGVLTLVTLKTEVLQDRGITGSILINPTGDITLDPGGNDVLPYENYDINLGMINKKYLTLHAAELWVETLVAADVMATIGGRVLIAPTTTLVADAAPADTSIYVKHNQMAVGDRVYLEADGKVEWMAITSGPTAFGSYWYYIVTRDLDGSGANQWYAGDAVLNTGNTGDGYIDIYSVHSIRSGVHYGPTIVGNIRTGTTYSNLIEGWAIGNLNGLYGYGVDIYGAAFGKYENSSSFLAIDPTNGIRMIYKNIVGANITLAQWDISGNLTIGQVGASQDNIFISAGAISIRNNTTERIAMTSAGELTIKDSGGAAVFTFSSAAGAEFTKPLTLATTGGIYQGTGTFAAPTTGLKIYNSGGYGVIAGYNTGVLQWYGNTDGKLYAGAGKVLLDSIGITIEAGNSNLNQVKWKHNGTQIFSISAYESSATLFDTVITAAHNLANYSNQVRLVSYAATAGYKSSVELNAGNSTLTSYLKLIAQISGSYQQSGLQLDDLNATYGCSLWLSGGICVGDPAPARYIPAGDIEMTGSLSSTGGVHVGTINGTCYTDDLVVDGGIVVGRTADPAAGDIHFTGDLNSYKNSTTYTGYIFIPLTTALASTSWDGDTYYAGSNTLIDMSAVFGCPAGIKAVLLSITIKDLGATDTNDAFLAFCNTSGGTQYCVIRGGGDAIGQKFVSGNLIVPCNANGDIYYRVVATTSGISCVIQVWGYWI